MHMVNTVEGVVLSQNDVIKTHAARHLKGGFQASKPLDGGIRLDEVIALQNGHAAAVFDRYPRAVKPAVISGVGCALLRGHRILVDVFARPTGQRGNSVSADPLGDKAGFDSKLGIAGHGAPIGTHWNP